MDELVWMLPKFLSTGKGNKRRKVQDEKVVEGDWIALEMLGDAQEEDVQQFWGVAYPYSKYPKTLDAMLSHPILGDLFTTYLAQTPYALLLDCVTTLQSIQQAYSNAKTFGSKQKALSAIKDLQDRFGLLSTKVPNEVWSLRCDIIRRFNEADLPSHRDKQADKSKKFGAVIIQCQVLEMKATRVLTEKVMPAFREHMMEFWSLMGAREFGEGKVVTEREVLGAFGNGRQNEEVKRLREALDVEKMERRKESRDFDKQYDALASKLDQSLQSHATLEHQTHVTIANLTTQLSSKTTLADHLHDNNAALREQLEYSRAEAARLQRSIAEIEGRVGRGREGETGLYEVDGGLNPTVVTQGLESLIAKIHGWVSGRWRCEKGKTVAGLCWEVLGASEREEKVRAMHYLQAYECLVWYLLLHHLQFSLSDLSIPINITKLHSYFPTDKHYTSALENISSRIYAQISNDFNNFTVPPHVQHLVYNRVTHIAFALEPEACTVNWDAGREGVFGPSAFWEEVGREFVGLWFRCRAMKMCIVLPLPPRLLRSAAWEQLLEWHGVVLEHKGDIVMGDSEDDGDDGGLVFCDERMERAVERGSVEGGQKMNVRFCFAPGIENERGVVKKCGVWCD
ncbi:hypothetical protein HDV00_004339 [Rhizophlyctis rosea]|nr:hypothetical protein HDV00_004339 [Rhizophlyctis rosea]